MGKAAYTAEVRLAGTPVALTDAAASLTSGTSYQIDSPSQRKLDINQAVIATDDGTPVAITSIDYMTGTVVLASAPSGTVRVSGAYIPTAVALQFRSYSLDLSGDVLDSTTFTETGDADQGFRKRMYGLHDVTLNLSGLHTSDRSILNSKLDREKVYVAVERPDSSGFAGWWHVNSDNLSGDIGSLESEELELSLHSNEIANISFSEPI